MSALLCRLRLHRWDAVMRNRPPHHTREMGLRCRRCGRWDDPKPFFRPAVERAMSRRR